MTTARDGYHFIHIDNCKDDQHMRCDVCKQKPPVWPRNPATNRLDYTLGWGLTKDSGYSLTGYLFLCDWCLDALEKSPRAPHVTITVTRGATPSTVVEVH